MLKDIEFKLATLPGSGLWTGDAEQKMSILKGSSVIGGMRFWTEALLRAQGHRVCDCIEDKGSYNKNKESQTCPACHIFGCTGLARSFNLHIDQGKFSIEQKHKTNMFLPNTKSKTDRTPNYAIACGLSSDDLALSLSCNRELLWPKHEHKLSPEALIATTLMLEYGALGANDQYGCGLTRITNREEILAKIEAESLAPKGNYENETLPDLKKFFFFRTQLNNIALEKAVPDSIQKKNPNDKMPASAIAIIRLRRFLRDSFRGSGEEALRHWLCGSLNRTGSHISVGVSNNQLYLWGWLPEKIERIAFKRDHILDRLKDRLLEISQKDTAYWKEFNSKRDNCNSPKTWNEYLNNMLKTAWRQ